MQQRLTTPFRRLELFDVFVPMPANHSQGNIVWARVGRRRWWAPIAALIASLEPVMQLHLTLKRTMDHGPWTRFQSCFLLTVGSHFAGISGGVGEAERAALLASLEPFMQQHLTRALNRLNDAIGVLFTAKPASGPQPADISSVQKMITQIAQVCTRSLLSLRQGCSLLISVACRE